MGGEVKMNIRVLETQRSKFGTIYCYTGRRVPPMDGRKPFAQIVKNINAGD
jgi:hypothetical protein